MTLLVSKTHTVNIWTCELCPMVDVREDRHAETHIITSQEFLMAETLRKILTSLHWYLPSAARCLRSVSHRTSVWWWGRGGGGVGDGEDRQGWGPDCGGLTEGVHSNETTVT